MPSSPHDSSVDTHGVTTWEPRTLGDRLSVSVISALLLVWYIRRRTLTPNRSPRSRSSSSAHSDDTGRSSNSATPPRANSTQQMSADD